MDELVQELNRLLEAERGSVEALVDLTRMTADILEREMLQRIGGDEAWACASLHGQIEALGGTPSRRIAPLLAQIRARDHFAARLRVLSQQQQAVLESLTMLLDGQHLPEEVRALLTELYRVHVPNIAWCEQRAAVFGAHGVQDESAVKGSVTEGRILSEDRAVTQRGKNRRQVGYDNKRRAANQAEPQQRMRLTSSENDRAGQEL
jgi:Domain of unknown function (DUF6306)